MHPSRLAWRRLAPGHAAYAKIDVGVHIDSDAGEATLQEVHERSWPPPPVGHSLTNPVEVDVRLV